MLAGCALKLMALVWWLVGVQELLSSEETRVKSENTVFTIVTQWVARRCHHDKQATGRQQGDEEAEEEEQRVRMLMACLPACST